jgi:uncharacterized alpha-E superfamily protein
MLSRIADSIYWMSRYFGRAGGTARLMEINLLYLLEAEDDHPEDDKWRPLLQIISAEEAFTRLYGDGPVTAGRMIQFMTSERSNSSSIRTSVRLARENARIVRDRISREMWECINEFWLSIDRQLKSPLPPTKAGPFFSHVRNEVARFTGLTSTTMMRGEAFGFYHLGTYLERVDMTARILDVKYHLLLPDLHMVGSALDYYQWAALLKSLSGYEAFRRTCHAGFRPIDVVDFIIFKNEFPRSLAHCVRQMRWALDSIGSPEDSASRQAMARLRLLLDSRSAEDIFETGLHEFLQEFLGLIAQFNAAVQAEFLDTPMIEL